MDRKKLNLGRNNVINIFCNIVRWIWYIFVSLVYAAYRNFVPLSLQKKDDLRGKVSI